jgi:hypothetical protein
MVCCPPTLAVGRRRRVLIAGAVTHGSGRDRPGVTFINPRTKPMVNVLYTGGMGSAPQAGADGVGAVDLVKSKTPAAQSLSWRSG